LSDIYEQGWSLPKGPSLARKHYTNVDVVCSGKHTSLQFRNSNYQPKTFYRIGAMIYTRFF